MIWGYHRDRYRLTDIDEMLWHHYELLVPEAHRWIAEATRCPAWWRKLRVAAMAPGLRRRAGALFETWHCCKISDDQRRSKESKLALSTWVRWASEGLSLGLACELVLGSSWSIGKTFWNLKKLKIADICFECFNIFDNLCPLGIPLGRVNSQVARAIKRPPCGA